MKYLFFLFSTLGIISCNSNDDKIHEIREGEFLIKAKKDCNESYTDTVFYYLKTGSLISKVFYNKGIKNGDSINFYDNGNPMDIYSFKSNLLNGYHFIFDSKTKKVIYSDYFYNGLSVGPIVFYNKRQEPKEFYFKGFDNRTLLGIYYDNWQGFDNIFFQYLINSTCKISMEDTSKAASIFLYLIHPPKISIRYSVFKSFNSKEEQIMNIDYDIPFIEFKLPISKLSEEYTIQANVFDSINNKEVVLRKKIECKEY